ncbi:MAG: class I SAM-dependent methyltransferase [Actinomycetota bacterium]
MTDDARWQGYAPMARHVAPAAAHLLELLGPASGPLLDLGSGTGLALTMAADGGHEAIGIDASLGQLTAASAACVHAAADARSLPFRSASFGGAISNVALIFVPEPAVAVGEVARVLRGGARFAFSAWRADGWPDACRRVLADALGRPHRSFPTELGDRDTAASLLTDAGFTGIKHHNGTVRWTFRDLDDAVDTLTNAAGGLRLLRSELSGPAWAEAKPLIAEQISRRAGAIDHHLVLDDPYLITTGLAPIAISR